MRPKGISPITENKKAHFDYFIVETYEAGLMLTGSEVKSIRAGQVQLKDSYIAFKGEEAFLQNAHIAGRRRLEGYELIFVLAMFL